MPPPGHPAVPSSDESTVSTVPRRVLPVIVLAQLAGTSPWFAVNAVMGDLQREQGYGASDLGTLTSAVQLGFIVGTLVFALLDRARAENRQLDTEYKRLDAERQAQATNLRVEKTAREKLHMRNATPAVTQYVIDPAASASGAASGVAAGGAR